MGNQGMRGKDMNQPMSQSEQDTASLIPFVSVIVPVFNDAKRLKLCLRALASQTYPKSHYEVIVVDNGSDDLGAVKDAAAGCLGAIAIQELTPGSYAARNKGISSSKGEIIAFTDADCIPAPDWLEKGSYYLRSVPNCGMVVGKVEMFFQDPSRPTLAEFYQSVTAFPQECWLQAFRGGATANVFTWRRVIDQVGMFDERLKSFGDMEWGKRVHLAGYEQFYAATAQVKHPARRTWAQLRQKAIRTAGGMYDHFVRQENSFLRRNKAFAYLLFYDFLPPVKFVMSTFKNPKIEGFGQKVKVSLLSLLLGCVSAWEKIRLNFGGVSTRA